jgi:type IV pilus assembly protein PilC
VFAATADGDTLILDFDNMGTTVILLFLYLLLIYIGFFRRFSMKQIKLMNEEIGSLCMALGHLIHAGISTGDAFVLLKEDEEVPILSELLEQMSQSADDGAPLAVVFQETGVFPAYVCTLLEVGEQVGKSDETLIALANYYDGRARLEQRIRASLMYPSVLLGVLLAVVVILLVWVLPVFDNVYAQMGARLSGVAGGLLVFGQALGKAMPVLCGILVVMVVVLAGVMTQPRLRAAAMAEFRKKMGDRGVLGWINKARFIQALSLALSSGLTSQEAVRMSASLAEGAPSFQKRCNECKERIEEGDSLSQALRATKLLANMDCRLLEAGERSGYSETVMRDIANRLLENSEDALEHEVGKIEPVLVLTACGMVGVIILSAMLPLMNIMAAIG